MTRIKLNGLPELSRLWEEARKAYVWDHEDTIGDIPSYTWKTTRTEAKPRKIDPKTALLEAEPGPDGVFRVERESFQQGTEEDLEEAIAEFRESLREETERTIRGIWGVDFGK